MRTKFYSLILHDVVLGIQVLDGNVKFDRYFSFIFILKTLGTNHLFQKFIFLKLSHILFFWNIYILNKTNRFSSIYNIFIFDTNEVANLSLNLH